MKPAATRKIKQGRPETIWPKIPVGAWDDADGDDDDADDDDGVAHDDEARNSASSLRFKNPWKSNTRKLKESRPPGGLLGPARGPLGTLQFSLRSVRKSGGSGEAAVSDLVE